MNIETVNTQATRMINSTEQNAMHIDSDLAWFSNSITFSAAAMRESAPVQKSFRLWMISTAIVFATLLAPSSLQKETTTRSRHPNMSAMLAKTFPPKVVYMMSELSQDHQFVDALHSKTHKSL